MDAYRRRQAILSLLESAGEVEIDDLAGRFAVSPNSIRNDLDLLEREGQLTRVARRRGRRQCQRAGHIYARRARRGESP